MAHSKVLKLWPVVMGGKATPWYLSGGVSAANCLAAYKAIGAASLAASYVNLANPGTYNISPSVAPTWNAVDGWIFNGASQYVSTTIAPANGATATMSVIIKFAGCLANTGYMFGCDPGTGASFTMTPRRADIRRYVNGNVNANVAAVSEYGVQAIAGNKGYMNGVEEATINTSTSVAAATMVIGKGTGGFLFAGNIQAVAIYNIVLTPTQVEAVTAAMGFF